MPDYGNSAELYLNNNTFLVFCSWAAASLPVYNGGVS